MSDRELRNPSLPPADAEPIKDHRAERLRKEVSNCIALAVDAGDDPFAGELLNEAIRLAARVRATR